MQGNPQQKKQNVEKRHKCVAFYRYFFFFPVQIGAFLHTEPWNHKFAFPGVFLFLLIQVGFTVADHPIIDSLERTTGRFSLPVKNMSNHMGLHRHRATEQHGTFNFGMARSAKRRAVHRPGIYFIAALFLIPIQQPAKLRLIPPVLLFTANSLQDFLQTGALPKALKKGGWVINLHDFIICFLYRIYIKRNCLMESISSLIKNLNHTGNHAVRPLG